jgi:hypothetical protein
MADYAPPLPDPTDELLHVPWGDESLPWKDTWYFSVLDVTGGVHLAMHMTISANRAPDTRIAVGVRDHRGETVVIRREDGRHDQHTIGNSLARLEVVNLSWDSGHALRWLCNAPEFEFDVLVRGVHFAPFFDVLFPGANPSGKDGYSYSHTEQLIRGEGSFRRRDDAAERAVSAVGWRDRGWGRRKSEISVGTGYDLVGGVLPDGSAFALSGMRNVEHAPDAPLPVYGFLTDATTVVPAVSGIYYKDSRSFPTRLGLEFADGRRVDGEFVQPLSTLGVSFHDAEPDRSGIAIGARDYYSMLIDADGVEFPVFSNEGHALRADVTRDARFFGATAANVAA